MWSWDGSEAEGQGNGTINRTFASPFCTFYNKKKKAVQHMFGRKKKNNVYVELNPAEVKLLIKALMNFRNKCMALGKPTEDINDLLLMVMK